MTHDVGTPVRAFLQVRTLSGHVPRAGSCPTTESQTVWSVADRT
jgi:hypothetical protein